MARYDVPTVYYQSSIYANTAVEVTHIKSLSWSNRTNNNGSFELIIPLDSELTLFEPKLGGYIRLDPGDTIMQIEKRERVFDEWGNYWWKLGGRPYQVDDEITRAAQNGGFFFRHVYDGISTQTYKKIVLGTPVTTVNKIDIAHSSVYEDNLGGFEDDFTDTVTEAFSWGTIVKGQPRPTVTTVQRGTVVSVTIGSNATTSYGVPDPRAGYVDEQIVYADSNGLNDTGYIPEISNGSASGINGNMRSVTYPGSWIQSDVTSDTTVYGHEVSWRVHTTPTLTTYFHVAPRGIIPIRKITLKSLNTYMDEMWDFMNSLPSPAGKQPAVIHKATGDVQGGHAGYSFKLKSKGEVEKRYKVDFNIGDTILVNDTRLNVLYTDVVTGALETIDGNGYNVEIELGTLGATLEQRVQRVI